MQGTTTRQGSPAIGWLAMMAACLAAPAAHAGASASIDVTGLRVSVVAVAPHVTPAVSFAGAGGSTSACQTTTGRPPADHTVTVGNPSAFGAVASAMSSDPAAGGTASLAGDVFGGGASVLASAYASSPGPAATGQGTVGLVNDVGAAVFTLGPGTRMTITASVLAIASVDGNGPDEMADAGLLLTIADLDGGGLQFTRVGFDALALGLFGAYQDTETSFLSLVYENDTDADITGLFSGYVAAFATAGDPSAVPEPGSLATMLAGLALLGACRARRRVRAREASAALE